MRVSRQNLRRASAALLLTGALAAQDGEAGLVQFVQQHCADCHGGDTTKGGFDLVAAPADETARLWRWSRARARVLAGEMPPPDAEAPPPAEREAFVQAVATALRDAVPRLPTAPGRVTVRRLSRTQWENCVRDLFGVIATASAFPADDLAYGFDTIGDALSFSTLHLEAYLRCAGEVAELVFDGEDPQRPTSRRLEAEGMALVDGPGAGLDGEVASLYTRATLEQPVRLVRDGTYRLRVSAGGDQAGDEPAKLVLRLDGRDLDTFDVGERALRVFEITLPLARGEHRLGVSFPNDFYDPQHKDEKRRDRNLYVDWLELVGPLEPPVAPPAQAWLQQALAAANGDDAKLRAFVRAALPRLWRRPATDAEIGRLVAVGKQAQRDGGTTTAALRLVLEAMLVSPYFLFRIEDGGVEGQAGAVVPLPGHVLAARLSFFLWASTPDPALADTAAKGQLATPAGLRAATERLLADPRTDALAGDFAAQWLELRALGERMPDPARFPGFDDELRAALRTETELLVRAVLREGRDVRELLDCDFTHVDARLAAFYGVPAPAAPGFQRVVLPESMRERGGVLGHASMHAVTSNPTRTSPVKRGKWILEHLLGQPPPPPPPGNDTLAGEQSIDSSKTFREQLAQHRARSECAGCHVRMDTLGFALEAYDAIGRHRTADAGGAIDSSGELPDGRRLQGLTDLKAVLKADPAFVHTLAHKLFVYAVGREGRPIDRLRLQHAVDGLLANGKVTFADLVHTIVQGDAFRLRVVEKPAAGGR